MKRVLFICTHNSNRSQMAEGFLRELFGDRYEVSSAGTKPTHVSPEAVKVMKEVGVDMSGHRSKSLEQCRDAQFDYVVTVCDSVREACPFFPGARTTIHKSFRDPWDFRGTGEEVLDQFREVSDEIREWVIDTFGE